MSTTQTRLPLKTLATATLLLVSVSQSAAAGVAQSAYNNCQAALKERYGESTRVSLKRTSERGSKITVKTKVKAAGESFTSTCVVHSSGQITLTGEDGRLFEAVAATNIEQ